MTFPKAVFFIVGTEFCEKFCYFGMRTILFLYLMEILHYSKETSMVIYHTFDMLCFFFPLIFAVVADSWLGKYRTILYLSVVYVISQTLLSASSTPWFHLIVREISLLGLFLLAVGSGGIKPCLISFGGEQFKLPEQKSQMSNYFAAYYICFSTGGLISTVVIPMLRKDVTCFNLNTCYPLAFLVPSICLILALVIYVAGKRSYKMKNPEDNVLFKVIRCICHAIRRKVSSSEKRKHWLDYADNAYENKIINDTKSVFKILSIISPLIMVWALYNQLSSRWTYQATRMNGEFFGYLIKPDQTGVLNTLLLTILLPVFQWIIYPFIERVIFINSPLRKMTIGGILVATSFILSGILELRLESTYAVQPAVGFGHVRIFNTINCPAELTLDGKNLKLEPFGLYQNLSIPVTGSKSLKYDLSFACSSVTTSNFTGSINVVEEKSLSYLLRNDDGIQTSFSDTIDKSETGDPKVRAIILNERGIPANLSLHLDSTESYQLNANGENFFTNFIEVKHNAYNISVGKVQLASDVLLKTGGVYAIIGRISADGIVLINTATLVQPNSIHMVWLLPQYLVLTFGEIMVFINAKEFAYTQAPCSMKSMMQAFFLLTSTMGNLVVVIITKAHFFDRQVFETFLYAALLYASMFIFSIMAIFYKYVDPTSNENSVNNDVDLQTMHTKEGIGNEAYCDKL